MKHFIFLTLLLLASFSSCKPKQLTTKTPEQILKTDYQLAKYYLSEADYEKGLKALDRAIAGNDQIHMEELYYLKGFLHHAYGETTSATAAYQKVIEHPGVYSIYRKRAQQLLDLTLAEEKWKMAADEKMEGENEVNKLQKDQKTDFLALDIQPRFPECPEGTNIEIQKCSNMIVKQHIVKNYDLNVGSTFGIYHTVRTVVNYTIDKEGEIINLYSTKTDQLLSLEARRVIYCLPKMVPAQYLGKKVDVSFSIPVTYQPIE